MKNAFTDFKAKYAGKDPAEMIEADARKKLEQAYADTYNRLFRMFAVARRELSYSSRQKNEKLLAQVAKELDKLKGTAGKYLKQAILAVSEYAAYNSVSDMTLAGGKLTHNESFYLDLAKDYAAQAHKDTYSHVAALTDRMKQKTVEMLREETAMISRRQAVEGISRKEAYKLLKDKILSRDPEFSFVDRRGRTWATKDYLNMLTRTVLAETQREVYADSLAKSGRDLVRVSVHGAKDACSKWEGKVLSLTGATPGYPTVAEAKATNEIFHPRCRHRLLAHYEDEE